MARTGLPLDAILVPIGAVERDTGLSKDTLRVWERRYGFPAPQRDVHGERAYPLTQLERLRILKRLVDAGHRPGRIVALPLDALERLADEQAPPLASAATSSGGDDAILPQARDALLSLLRSHDIPRLKRELTQARMQLGLSRFVTDLVGPLNAAVGDAWMRGRLEIFEEHLLTELLQSELRSALHEVPAASSPDVPQVLLATFPGEPHGLGLLMAEAVFAMHGASCWSLGPQTPLWDMVLAARAQGSHVVALAFTGCMNPNQVVEGLTELRMKLPAACEIWAGGSAPVLHRRPVDGVNALATLGGIPALLDRWRAQRR